MRGFGWRGSAVVLAALGLAGCGPTAGSHATHAGSGAAPGGVSSAAGGGPKANPSAAPADPQAVLLDSVQRTTGQSYEMDLSATVAVSSAGGAAPSLGELSPMQMAAHFEVESARRMTGTLTLTLGSSSLSVRMVAYDGTVYSSLKGSQWRSQPQTGEAGVVSPTDALQFLEAIGDVQDQGPATVDGVHVELYRASFDRTKLRQAMSSVFTGLDAAASGAALSQALGALTGQLTAAVDGQGRVVTDDCTASTTFGIPGLSWDGTPAPVESYTLHVTVSGHFYDYGVALTVVPPPGASAYTATPPPSSGDVSNVFSNISDGLGT